jgi:hypothetical protein
VLLYAAVTDATLTDHNVTLYTQDRPVIIPGHGQHLTGLGHVQDLAVAMANVLGKDVSHSINTELAA